MRFADRYEEEKKQEDSDKKVRNRLEYRYKYEKAPEIADKIISRYNALDSYNQDFLNSYKNRYFDADGNYINSYRGDSNDWYSSVQQKKEGYDSEVNYIKGLLDEYKDYFNEDFSSSILNGLDSNGKIYSDVLDYANKDIEYYSQWESQEAYDKAMADAAETERLLGIDVDVLQGEIDLYEGALKQRQENDINSKIPEDVKHFLIASSDKLPNISGGGGSRTVELSQSELNAVLKAYPNIKEVRKGVYQHYNPETNQPIGDEIHVKIVNKPSNKTKKSGTGLNGKKFDTGLASGIITIDENGNYIHPDYGEVYNIDEGEYAETVLPGIEDSEFFKYIGQKNSLLLLSDEELEAGINSKTQDLNKAKRLQKWKELSSVADPTSDFYDPEFEVYAQKGKELGGSRPVYSFGNYLGNNEVEDIRAFYKDGEMSSGRSTRDNQILAMTDDEVSIYNYYLGKYGKDKAEEYFNTLEEGLNQKYAIHLADEFDTKIGSLYFASVAGLDQYATGVKNLLKTSDDYIPASPYQQASAMIREDMKEDGWGWQAAYDVINTTSNMLPSIFTSTALGFINPTLGTAAGLTAMGSSVYGNAYAEMLNLGYSKKQAHGYATLTSASEMGLSYLLGGFGKLGGKLTGNAFSKLSTKLISNIDKAFARVAIGSGTKIVGNMVSEFGEEYLQEILTPVFKNIALGTDEDFKLFTADALYAGFLGALSAGMLESGGTIHGEVKSTKQTSSLGKKVIESGAKDSLVDFGKSLSADSLAYKIANKVDENTGAYTIGRLLEEAGATLSAANMADIQKSLIRKGVSPEDAQTISKWLNNAVMGAELTDAQISALEDNEVISQTFRDVIFNQQHTVNQRTGRYLDVIDGVMNGKSSTEVATETDTTSNDVVEQTSDIERAAKVYEEMGMSPEEAKNVAVAQLSEGGADVSSPATEKAAETISDNDTVTETHDVAETNAEIEDNRALSIADVSKNYGAQAGAVEATYNIGGGNQDVAKFDKAYRAAYDMGNSGVALSYAMNSDSTSYLTEKQIELAHETGKAASDVSAKEQESKNKKAINGKTGRKKGVVRGENITISELKKSFNDTQNVAYKVLTTYAEATGIDIVLYKSDTDADGNFVGSQGKFKWSEDTIYIDINAGLAKITDVNKLAKYTMLRTFSHEFIHFIEKWNPVYYNEFRKVVFDTLTERGENVNDLIEEKMSMTEGITYEKASREVVAEAMTDILPDANFVETLATKHKNIFDKLLQMLKDFLSDLKAYFKSLNPNSSREANALKEQIEDAVHYVDSIVKLFDKVAVEAVENYQMTVATDEVTENSAKAQSTESINTDNNAEKDIETAKTDKYEHFTITDNNEFGSLEITFDGKPSEAIRNVLKDNKFRWHGKKGVWYGKGERADIVKALQEVYNAEAKAEVKTEETAPVIEKTATDIKTPEVKEDAEVQQSIEEKEKAYKKKFSSWLKKAQKQYVLSYGKETYLSDGVLGMRASDDMINQARIEFSGVIYETALPQQTVDAIDKATTLITDAPLEGELGDKSVYVFNVDGKQYVYDKKYLSKLDGNLFYMGDFTKGFKILKAVDAEGNVEGFLLPLRNFTEVKNTKLSKLKTFSSKLLSQISNQEVSDNGENADNRGTVQQPVSDRQGDSQVLDELQASDVQGDVQGRDSVGDSIERGQQAVRDDVRPDATGVGRGPSERDSQSGDIRRADELTEEAPQQVTGKLPASEEETKQKAEKLHREVTEQIAQQSTETPKGKNFIIGDTLDLPNGEKARYKANIDAIKLVKQLEAEGRYATEAEQVILSKYVGWGGLANAFDERKADWSKEYSELKELLTKEEYELARGSTLNAHYTDISVIKAMYDGLNQLGFNGGRMMEPSSGVGNFVGAMPADMSAKVKSWTMVELDSITGLIAKYLYPNADVRIQGFEKTNIPNNFMDVIISNVPFGNYPITDKAYPKKVTSAIHNYFFAKSLDKVRPGGIVMFITSSYTMNSKDETVRKYIMQRADLLGAIRLPDSAFKGNAGTEVVTDILILKKRAANTEYAGENFLEAPYKYINGYNGAYINSYFDAHPEMVLGTATMDGGMYRGNNLTYKALEDKGSLADQIREAFKSIKGKMDYPAKATPEKTNFAVERANKKTKDNGYVAKEGKIYQNKDGELVEQAVTSKVAERIKGMLEIRDAAKELITYQQQGLNETEIKKARAKLNKVYDAFVKKNGFINSPANKSAFKEDPDCFSLFALENWDSDKKTATKADIFSKNTIAPNRTVTSAKDVSEGLIVSVNQTGGVDTALIARLTGKTEADVKSELIESRKVFKNRDGVLETAETYLSGNVRAKLRDAEALVPIDKDYQKNVEALKAVMPKDVSHEEIFVNPGTPWIPSSVYSDFAAYMLGGRNTEWRQDIDVTRNAETGNFTVELKTGYLKHNAQNTQKWGTPRRSFIDLFDAMLNSKSVVVKDKLSDGSFEINKDATAAANEKIENITKEFQEWLWKDEARRTELTTLYNEVFNSIVTPKYNGDNLTVNGANAMKPLRPHQRNAVQRVISSGGNTLLAHKVGAGKTYEMAAAAMKLKELGLVKKPLFAVPKSLVAQWGTEFIDFFPTAKLLVAEATDFATANRKVFMNRIANGDYDAVIVSYEQFEKLPVSDDFTRELYQEQINSVIAAIEEAKAEKGAKAMSVKDLEKKRKSLQAKIDKLTDKAKDEGNIDFEELGVDSLFIDEAHNFKNLFYTTSMTNVSGLGNKDGSKRAFDLYTKVRYLQKLNGGKGIVFATATPVMNSMSEMYIMQKYLQPDLLEQLGLNTFDAWAKQFGEVVNGVEIKPSGQGYRVKQSFSRFKNMTELQLLFRNFADVLTDIPGLKIPKMKGGKVNIVVCEPGQFQKDFMKELEKRADNIKNVDPSEDNMLKITSDGRKISYTQRMIDPSLPYEEGCKIYRCADNVVKTYNESGDVKGTQLIFCDMATPKGKSKSDESSETEDAGIDMESARLYDDIKARMIEGGIPAKEIAFIHEADTDQKKKKLFADVNEGKVRVLIGSTGKMGVGMNAQRRVVAIHHLDAPWRPGDVEQRNGRAYRQGNINDEVECFNYVTEGSFDARLWDILERKQNFINQVMNGENVGRETEDTGEVTLSAAEVKALASGSPLIMEQVQLDTDIKKLESLYRAHNSAILNAKSKLEKDRATIATMEKQISAGKADIEARKDTYSEGKFSITIGNQKFTEKKDAGIALMAEATAKATEEGYTTIGSFAGFDIRVVKTHEGIKGLVSGKQGYSFNTYPGNTTFMINHLIAAVEGINENVSAWEQIASNARNDIIEQEQLIATPFAKQEELDQKRARYNEVMDILNPKEEQSLDNVAEDTVQEQSRKYLEDEKPKKYNKRSKPNETETLFMIWENGSAPVGEVKRFVRFGKHRYYEKTETGCVELSRKQYNERIGYDAEDTYARIQRQISGTVNSDESSKRDLLGGLNSNRNSGGTSAVSGQTLGEKLRNDTGRSVSSVGGDNRGTSVTEDDEQHQERTGTLSDSEVLALATSELLEDDDLTVADKSAIEIIQKHLSNLENLQADRVEQGRLYKEQQFGAKVDRAEAAKTLNRMKTLDQQIEKVNEELLSLENKGVLKSVLQKARKVVEKQERQRGDENLKRWRDRRNNADAIKKYRDRIRGDVDELSNWILHPNNKEIVKHVPDVLKGSVIPFLSSINFMSKRSLGGGNATVSDKVFIERLDALQAAIKSNIDVHGLYSGYNDLPPDFIESLQHFTDTAKVLVDKSAGEFIINQMTSEELKTLSKVVRTLKKYIMQINRFHYNAMYSHVYEAGENSIEYLKELKDAGNTNAATNFLFWQQIRPAYAFERFGKGGIAIYDGLRRGQAKLAFNTKEIQAFAEKTYTEKEVKEWENEIKTFSLGEDIVKMPVSYIMGFYELSKDPEALEHINGEGIRVATYTHKGKKISDVGHVLTVGEFYQIISSLTDRQKEVADSLQKYMATQGGKWGNYVSVARFGEELFTNPNYYPINSDGRHLQATADEHPSAAALYALLNMSFTKSRKEGANNRIVIYSIFDVFANHMASMAQYNAMALPILDALKWFNYQQVEIDDDGNKHIGDNVRERMDRAFGVPEEARPGKGKSGYAQDFVMNIIKAFNGTEAQGTPYDSLGLKSLHRYNIAQVAYNFRVVVQQPLAITRAGMLIDYRSILKGMKLKPSAIKNNIEEMQKYSGIAAWKSLGFYDVNISRGLTSIIKHDNTFMDKVGDVGMWGAEKADLLTWAAIWSACKEEVKKKEHLTPESKGFYEAVTKLFEDVIYKTQVVDSILTKNEFMRDKGTFARLTGSFMSEPSTNASMLIDAYDKYQLDIQRGMSKREAWQKNGKMIGRRLYVYGVGAVLLAVVQAAADALRDDDDYEEWYEKWLEAFGGNFVDELMPFNKLPILSDFYDLAKELLSILGVDTYGNPPQSVFMQWYDSLIKGTEIIYDKIANEDTNYTWYGGIYKLLQAASGMTGLPMASATREAITAWNNTIGAFAPSLKVTTYEPSELNKIKYAYEDGYLTDEEATAQILEKGLADNENEAYFIIQGWEAGDGYSRYDKLYDAVLNGGDVRAAMDELTSHGYSEEDVKKQIKSQVGKWYYDSESKVRINKQQAVNMLKKYTDMTDEEITSTINKWSSAVVTGIKYDDIDDEFMNGNITASRAIEMFTLYGSMTKEKATEKVTVLQFVKENPSCEGISYSAVSGYKTHCEPVGITPETFYDVWKYNSDTVADVDKNGKSISGSKKEKVLKYINSLTLSRKQKDSLYYAFGWAKSTINEAPWH